MVFAKLQRIVLAGEDAVDAAIKRFVEQVGRENTGVSDADRIAREIKEVSDVVTALTMNIDAANLLLLNDRLTQLRLRKECLERDLHVARQEKSHPDVGMLRTRARNQLAGLHDAMAGTRNDRTRDVIATYVD